MFENNVNFFYHFFFLSLVLVYLKTQQTAMKLVVWQKVKHLDGTTKALCF